MQIMTRNANTDFYYLSSNSYASHFFFLNFCTGDNEHICFNPGLKVNTCNISPFRKMFTLVFL